MIFRKIKIFPKSFLKTFFVTFLKLIGKSGCKFTQLANSVTFPGPHIAHFFEPKSPIKSPNPGFLKSSGIGNYFSLFFPETGLFPDFSHFLRFLSLSPISLISPDFVCFFTFFDFSIWPFFLAHFSNYVSLQRL